MTDIASALKLCLAKRPTCPVCERPTFGLLEGWRKHTNGHGLWTEAGYVRYRCAEHRRERNTSESNMNTVTVKLIPIHEPIAFNLADIQQAMREGEDLYQRRLAETRKMIAEREKNIPDFTRHTPCVGEYTPDERAMLFGDNPPPTVRLGGCGVEVSTTCRCRLSE